MTKLDRSLQRHILEALAHLHPGGTDEFAALMGQLEEDDRLLSNLLYLAGHGLVESGFVPYETSARNTFVQASQTRITHTGLDFLAEDGGLSAILGTVTVRLHEDDLRALVAARISASAAMDTPQKHKALDALRELPAESIKHLYLKVLDLGWDRAPDSIAAIKSMLGW